MHQRQDFLKKTEMLLAFGWKVGASSLAPSYSAECHRRAQPNHIYGGQVGENTSSFPFAAMRPRVQKPRSQKRASRRQLAGEENWNLGVCCLFPPTTLAQFCAWIIQSMQMSLSDWKTVMLLKQQNLSVCILQMKRLVQHDATLRMELISEISFLYSLAKLWLSLFSNTTYKCKKPNTKLSSCWDMAHILVPFFNETHEIWT